MLAISPLRNPNPCEKPGDAGAADEFSVEFDFDFSELFAGFDDGEALPELDVESSEIMLEFSSPETVEAGAAAGMFFVEEDKGDLRGEMMGGRSGKIASAENTAAAPERERGRKPAAAGQGKGANGRKKMKVDWTPELHRQFVQAVEQLGVEKAVPSRILELMGIDCLTRHNIASHLQKYRSHRKHMLVREAETTSWSQRRHVRAMTSTTTGGIVGPPREINPWLAPPMGFPPGAPHHHHIQMHGFRPLHVWGHPTVDQSLVHLWPSKHMFPIRPVHSPPWGGPHTTFHHPPPQPYASPWNPHFSKESLTQGSPYFAQQVPTMRFPAPPMAGIPPHPVYRPGDALPTIATPTLAPINQTDWLLQHNAYPSKESIDAAIGEVLTQPWLPVPLGLKPPSLESVMVELQKQGISVVPP